MKYTITEIVSTVIIYNKTYLAARVLKLDDSLS